MNPATKPAQKTPISSASSQTEKPASATDAETQANAEFRREFFERYPDLKPYEVVLDAVSEKLQAQGYKGESRDAVMATLAKEAKEVVALQEAAEQGDAEAQFNLGVFYRKGEPTAQDNAKAAKWLRRSADQGFVRACGALGAMYYTGAGVPKNISEGVRLVSMAADKGDAIAQGVLGFLYETGSDVPQDYVEAYSWYSRSAAQANTNAIASRARIYAQAVAAFKNEFYARYPNLKPYEAIVNWAANQRAASALPGTKQELMEAFAKTAREEINRLSARINDIIEAGDLRLAEPSPLPENTTFNFNRERAIREFTQDSINKAWQAEMAKHVFVENQTGLGQVALLALSNGGASASGNQQAAAPLTAAQLGWRYAYGYGVERDDTKAAYWYRKAAEEGDVSAQGYLGFLYQTGRGVQKDFVEAYKWFSLSAAHGDTVAAKNRDNLEPSLTPDQIAEAKTAAAAFVPRKAESP